MSRARVAVLAGALALLGVVLLRPAAPGASARPADAVERPAPPPVPRPAPPVPAPVRDIFSYANDEDSESAPPVRQAPAPVALPAPPSLADTAPLAPAGPRLVGILRQGGALRAALWLDGEVLVVRAGERAGSYTVLAIDEDDGVSLSDASGVTLRLAPPQE